MRARRHCESTIGSYVWTTDEETIFQLQAIGPIGIDYINPADEGLADGR